MQKIPRGAVSTVAQRVHALLFDVLTVRVIHVKLKILVQVTRHGLRVELVFQHNQTIVRRTRERASHMHYFVLMIDRHAKNDRWVSFFACVVAALPGSK